MAFTYDRNQLSVALNRIRLEIGDTDSKRPLLLDEEIGQILSEQSSFNLQVAMCCRLICSIFAGKPDRYRIENFTETLEEVFNRYKKMARRYAGMGGGTPWAGSISDSWKTTVKADTDLVKPSFTRGLHNNP